MFYFHSLDLNVNEWIPIKGCIEVEPSKSMSTGSCDIVVYWGYRQMDTVWSLLLLLRPWMGYGYTVIQVVCWVELPEQRRLYPIFCENMDSDKRDTTVYGVT